MKQVLLILTALCTQYIVYSQNNPDTGFLQADSTEINQIKPLRIGVKVGVPNLITANAEYLTPLLKHRLAITVDYMSLSRSIDDVTITYHNFEIGTNFYFNNKGQGLYAGLSYFSFDGEGAYTEVDFGSGVFGDGKGAIAFNTLNLKIGAKFGKIFYFRIEAGYGFGDIPEDVLVKINGGTQTTIEDIPELPGVSSSGIPIFNVGIGFSFL